MNTTKPLAIPTPKGHHDLRARDVGDSEVKRGGRAGRTPSVDPRPTLTMQRQLIASLVG